MKILFSTPSISRLYTGVFEVEKNIVINLLKQNISFEIHSLIDIYTYKDLHFWDSTTVFLYKTFGQEKYGLSFKLFRNVLKSNAEVGHIHSLWSFSSLALYLWSKFRKRPYLFSANAYLFDSALKRSRLKKKVAFFLCFRKIIESANCIQVNTVSEYNSVRSLGFKNPICVIPNGVSIPEIEVSNSIVPWGFDKNTRGKRILLFLSRIHPQKGINLLVEAWKQLYNLNSLDNWHLVIVGFNDKMTPFENELKYNIENHDVKNVITMLPGQYDEAMDICYQNCSGYILPSFNEGTSIAALNALAFSKPALLSEGCNIPDCYIRNAAIKIEATQTSIFNELIKFFDMNDLERKSIGEAGRRLVSESYSWDSVSSQILEIYKWINDKEKNPIPSSLYLH
jgi:glycosyltransferase involved in cell wall biosynthesis